MCLFGVFRRLPLAPAVCWKRSPEIEPDVHRKMSHLVAKNNALSGDVQVISSACWVHPEAT